MVSQTPSKPEAMNRLRLRTARKRTALDHTKGLTAFFKPEELRAVDRDNALRLIPRLKSS